MIRCSDDETMAPVLLEKLQERVKHPPNFADILAFSPTSAYGIKLVKEVDTARRLHRLEHEPQLSGSLTHKLGDQSVEDDCEEREMKLSGQRRGGHRLAGPWRTDQKKSAAGRQTVFTQASLLSLFAKYTL